MASRSTILGSSLAKKYWMALTGLFLCVFLVIHLAGNLQLIWGDALGFNEYTEFMTTFTPVKVISYVLYFSILFHAFDGLILTIQNNKARKKKYAYSRPDRNTIWASRNMGVLGTAIFVFLVIHMSNFWARFHWGDMAVGDAGLKDMHGTVIEAFKTWWYVLLYVISMVALGFHLWHGFKTSFRSLGMTHPKYWPLIKNTGYLFAVIVPALFALIPIYIFFNA